MIEIVTKKDLLSSKKILDPESYFNTHIAIKDLDDTDKYYLKKIDSAEVISPIAIKTKYGITSLDSISTGCKTLIILNHLIKENNQIDLSIDECGCNVINEVFKLSEQSNNTAVRFYIKNASSLIDPEINKYTYIANGKEIGNSLFSFMGTKDSV